MEKHEVQKLRELPIEGVAERLGLKVERHRCLCPFHDDHTPSLTFNVPRNTYRCYGCGAHGNTIDLALKMLPGRSFTNACQWLASMGGVILSEHKPEETGQGAMPFDARRYASRFEHPQLSPAHQMFLFRQRHLLPEVVRFCRLNSGRDWLQIPYYSQDWQLIGIQYRYMGDDPSWPRFRFPKAGGSHIYNLPVLKMLHPLEDLYITEGCSDCWAMLSAGHKAIAIPSATLLKKWELRQELQAARVPENGNTLHVFPDKDQAGENLYRELLSLAADTGIPLVRHELPDDCKDFSDLWVKQNTITPTASDAIAPTALHFPANDGKDATKKENGKGK